MVFVKVVQKGTAVTSCGTDRGINPLKLISWSAFFIKKYYWEIPQ